MVKIKSILTAFAAELRSPLALRAAKVSLIFILLLSFITPVFAISVTTTFNINDMSYVDQSTLKATTNVNQYTYVSGYKDSAYPPNVFTFDNFMLRFRFTTDDYPIDHEYPTITSFSPSATFNLPVPTDFYDQTYLVFTIATGLYTNQDKSLLTNILDDVSIYIDESRYYPSKQSITQSGCYWTFTVKLEGLSSDSTLTVSPIFQDFLAPSDENYGNFPSDVWWMVQFSELYFTGDQTAAAAYAASIDTLLKNDIQPTLENINNVAESIDESLDRLDTTIEEGVTGALDSLLADLQLEEENTVNALISEIQSKVDLSILDELSYSLKTFIQAFTGDHVGFSLTVPAISIPNIPGLFPGYQLTEEFTFNFDDVINIIPAVLLLLVRSFCTFLLVFFIVKDFMSSITSVLAGDRLSVISGANAAVEASRSNEG